MISFHFVTTFISIELPLCKHISTLTALLRTALRAVLANPLVPRVFRSLSLNARTIVSRFDRLSCRDTLSLQTTHAQPET